jgi:transcriptional regulator with XRE-family HTH domain
MNFGDLLSSWRKNKDLGIRDLGVRTGIDKSTISRIENKNTETTISTVVRLCLGLEIDLNELSKALLGFSVKFPERSKAPGVLLGKSFLTFKDLELLTHSYKNNSKKWEIQLSDWLNEVAIKSEYTRVSTLLRGYESVEENKVTPRIISPLNIREMIFPSHIYSYELQYPSDLALANILDNFEKGGVITPKDAGLYLKEIRNQKNLTQKDLERITTISEVSLSRLEMGMLDRIRLPDIVRLDQFLKSDGNLLAFYWYSCQFTEEFLGAIGGWITNSIPVATWSMERFQLATIFLKVFRWMEFVNEGDSSWIQSMQITYNQES